MGDIVAHFGKKRTVAYEMLRFFHDTRKLLYLKDYTTLKGFPVKQKTDYL